MNSKGITQFLINHAASDPVSFHMPGHKGAQLLRRFGYDAFLDDMVSCDITEITGADNLFQPEDIIAETMAKYRSLYDAKASCLLVNGSSSGIIASIMTCVPPGGKLIMARNCHKSVFNALSLGGIQPVYAHPSMVEEYGISGAVEPDEIARLLQQNPDASAVILPSPNYYGICSDIKAIAELVHAAGKFLIVDQAHGAHLKFFESIGPASAFTLPPSAETQGADFVINSTHKTLCSFTQSAVLNVSKSSKFDDMFTLEDKLQQMQSTSPSYLLMASLDSNADILAEHGRQLMTEWRDHLEYFYAEASRIPGLRIMDVPGASGASGMSGAAMDMTKLNLDMSACGLDGHQLEDALLERGIFAELVTGNILMCMTGIGNTRRDFDRLLDALRELASEAPVQAARSEGSLAAGASALWSRHRPLHDTAGPGKELIPLHDAAGRICASSIIPYPPGIPLICPGEEIGREEIGYITALRQAGEKVIGVDASGRIAVIRAGR